MTRTLECCARLLSSNFEGHRGTGEEREVCLLGPSAERNRLSTDFPSRTWASVKREKVFGGRSLPSSLRESHFSR
jgi:hypothetical protein